MTDDNSLETNVDMDDLDAFEDVFYGRKPEPEAKEPEEAAEEEEVVENEDDTLETEEDKDAEEEEALAEDDEPEDEPEEAPKPKGKKSFQQRIDELTADKYERQREVDALRQEIEKLKTRPEEKKTEVREQLPSGAPSPDAVNDKGEPVYPLGEFDPRFIRDLTRFTYEEEAKAADDRKKQETEVQQAQEAQQALTTSWNEKLSKAEEDIPDIREGITELTPILTKLDPAYGDYLAATVMQCENGPEVMYYLSQNIGEAQKIVASGAFAATLALGRLDAQFSKSKPKEGSERNKTKVVSEAPKPVEVRAKGRGSTTVTRPDTDDLDAFEKLFFKK